MKLGRPVLTLAASFALLNAGCIAASVGLAAMVIGDGIHDADVKRKRDQLEGKSATDADELLGPRLETLEDVEDPDRALAVYSVSGKPEDTSWYVVELHHDRVVAVSKKKQNPAGLGDALKSSELSKTLIGMRRPDCEEAAKLEAPVLVLRSIEAGDILQIYDVTGKLNLGGAKYCVLRFETVELCKKVNFVGLTASSKKGGIVKNPPDRPAEQ